MEVEIGKTYLDVWGNVHVIYGYVRNGFKQENKAQVWSMSGHFYKNDGKAVGGGNNLVVMTPKGEVAFWKKRISLILNNNSEDKIKLVAQPLQNMHDRIKELEGQ